MRYLIWVKWADIPLNCPIFSRLRQGRLCFFFLVLWCIFSFQEVQCFGFFNYLDLAFPIPHLVTVWTGVNSQSPKPICDFYGVIPNYLISAHVPGRIRSLTSFFSLELGTETASWLRCKNNTHNTEAKLCTISLHMWLGTNKQVRKWSI